LPTNENITYLFDLYDNSTDKRVEKKQFHLHFKAVLVHDLVALQHNDATLPDMYV
jgi:hypothetical protein